VVDSTPLDFAAVPRFIERNWRLEPLTDRDAGAGSLVRSLDFSRPPREAELISPSRAAGTGPDARRSVIYPIYLAALVVTALAFALAAIRSRSSMGAIR
jgi:hypothetical protein